MRWFRRRPPVIVVSGLPRSGTSMMMRMLEAGGLPILTDRRRAADGSNPHGYFEFEPVTRLGPAADLGWLRDARGKVVKIVSPLLTWLPETYDYRVVFMQRALSEVVASQEAMLAARGEASDQRGPHTLEAYAKHLAEVERFLAARTCFRTLYVDHRRVIEAPREEAERVARFLVEGDIDAMASAVDASLHRQRR